MRPESLLSRHNAPVEGELDEAKNDILPEIDTLVELLAESFCGPFR